MLHFMLRYPLDRRLGAQALSATSHFTDGAVLYGCPTSSEWLTLLLRIREVPGSNLGLETGYPD
jgi:hypothetical protein